MALPLRTTRYYSGQGSVLVSRLDSAGVPTREYQIGNCATATVETTVEKEEHKESQSGSRLTDLSIVTSVSGSLALALENFNSDALALALGGSILHVQGGSVTGEALKHYNGGHLRFARRFVSAVALKRGAQALTLYTNDATPYDYKLDDESGLVVMNDGAVTAVDKITTGGTAPTAITVGATTSVTVANTAAVGDFVAFTGFTGADAGLINGKAHRIVTATPTVITIDLNTTGKTITVGTPLSAFDGIALAVDYTYAAQKRVQAATDLAARFRVEFRGINTADGNRAQLVTLHKVAFQPAGLPLITEGVAAQITLNGDLEADLTKPAGESQLFESIVAADR